MPAPESDAFDIADKAYTADQDAKSSVDDIWDRMTARLSQTDVADSATKTVASGGPLTPQSSPSMLSATNDKAGQPAAAPANTGEPQSDVYAGQDVTDVTPAQKIAKALSVFGVLPSGKERAEHPVGSAVSEAATALDPLGSVVGAGLHDIVHAVGSKLAPNHPEAVELASDAASLASGRTIGTTGAAMGIVGKEEEVANAERAAVQGSYLEKAKAAVAGLEQKLAGGGAKTPMTHAEMVKAAGGIDPSEFSGAVLDVGHALSADQHIALSNTVTQLGQHLSDAATDLVKRATAKGMTPEEIPPEDAAHVWALHSEFARLHAMEQKASESTGQALNAQVLTKSAREAHAELSTTLQENLKDPNVQGQLLRGFAALDHPAQVGKFASDTVRDLAQEPNGWGKRLATYMQNAALWNPGLVVKKAVLDNLSMFEQPLLYALQGKMHDYLPSLVDGPQGDAAQAAHELMGKGLLQHFREQIGLNRAAWKNKIPTMMTDSKRVNTLGSEDDRFINETGAGLASHYSGFMASGRRMAMAMTEGPFAQSERMALHAMARLEAKNKAIAQFALEPKTGVASADAARQNTIEESIYQRLINHSPQRLQKAASKAALHTLYLNDPNALGQKIEGARELAGSAGKIGMRFLRVPWNIGMNEYAHTPLGFTGLSGGRLHNSENVAKATLGLGVTGLMALAHSKGIITGAGPHDPKERALWLQTHVPYSINVGSHHIRYDAWPVPFRKTMMTTADFLDVHGQLSDDDARNLGTHVGGLWQHLLRGGENVAESAGVAAARSVKNDPYLNWMDMWGKITDYGNGTRTAGQLKGDIENHIASAFTPSVIKDARYSSDDYQRNVQSMVDAAKNQLPMVSRSLLPVRDNFGNPKHVGGGYSNEESPDTLGKAWNFMMPAKVSNMPMNPPTYEIKAQQLFNSGHKDVASPPSRDVSWWSPEDKDSVDNRAGKIKHKQYEALTTGPNAERWNSYTEDQQARRLIHMNAAANRQAIKSMHHDNQALELQDKMMRKYHKVFRVGAEPIGVATP